MYFVVLKFFSLVLIPTCFIGASIDSKKYPDILIAVLCLVASTLSNPKDCSLPGSSVHGDSPGKNTGESCHALLQEIFPTWGLNPHLTSPALASGSFTTSDGKDLMYVSQTRRKGRIRKWKGELPDSQSSRCPSVPNSPQHILGDSNHSRRVHSICHHTVPHTRSLSLQKTEIVPHQSQLPGDLE